MALAARLALVALTIQFMSFGAAGQVPLLSKLGTGGKGVSLTNVISQAFKPGIPKPPVEVAVPTIQWQPVTVMTPTVQVTKMGFCIPRTQWSIVSADAVDCPPQTYLQQQNGQPICARTDCAGPVGKTMQPAAEQQKTNLLASAYYAIKKSMPQVWGGTAAAVCSTVFVKPIMSCPQDCISDVRQGPDQCLCNAGLMGCPFNYDSCGCADFQICVADSYWCDFYCKYAPSWYFAMVAKGEKACPLDPNTIDPIDPDPIYPGFNTINNNVNFGKRRLLAAQDAKVSSTAAVV